MSYLGSNLQTGDPTRTIAQPLDADRFSGNASTTVFTLSRAVGYPTDIEVVVENVQQEPTTAFTVNGTTLTFTEAPPIGTNNIYVIYQQSNNNAQVTLADGSVTYAKLANNIRLFTSDNLTPNGNNSVFTLSEPPADANTVFVTVDGVVQRAPVHYTTSGTTITFTSAPPASSNVHVRHLGFRTSTTVTAIPVGTYIPQPNIAAPTITGNMTVTGNVSAAVFTGSGSGITGLSQEVGQCRLVRTSATVLTLTPVDGQFIKIAGAIYAIPSAGVTLSNSGLSVSTLYYIYASISGGNVTLSASATAYATDTTAGNVGVRIKSGDNAFTLVGMIYTSAASQFVDTTGNRQVLSYFNRRDRHFSASASNYSTASTAMVVVTPILISSLNWADDGICVWLAGQAGMTGSYALQQAVFDNSTSNTYGVYQYIYITGATTNFPNLIGGWHQPAEGFHSYYMALGAVSGSGTTSINNMSATGYVRG